MPNTNAFYEVKFNGRHAGQDIVNIFHYRLGFDLIPGELNLAGADTLAGLVKDTVWDAPALRGVLPTSYLLESITVSPRDADFNLIFQLPYTLQVGEYGTANGDVDGSAPCAIVNANLTPTNILQGFIPPKRGYWAFGPLLSSYISGEGRIEGLNYDQWDNTCTALAATLTSVIPPATFHPIKLRVTRALGGLVTLNGWADVHSAILRHKSSFRRSRIGEA